MLSDSCTNKEPKFYQSHCCFSVIKCYIFIFEVIILSEEIHLSTHVYTVMLCEGDVFTHTHTWIHIQTLL